jgi:hypothetical protein
MAKSFIIIDFIGFKKSSSVKLSLKFRSAASELSPEPGIYSCAFAEAFFLCQTLSVDPNLIHHCIPLDIDTGFSRFQWLLQHLLILCNN